MDTNTPEVGLVERKEHHNTGRAHGRGPAWEEDTDGSNTEHGNNGGQVGFGQTWSERSAEEGVPQNKQTGSTNNDEHIDHVLELIALGWRSRALVQRRALVRTVVTTAAVVAPVVRDMVRVVDRETVSDGAPDDAEDHDKVNVRVGHAAHCARVVGVLDKLDGLVGGRVKVDPPHGGGAQERDNEHGDTRGFVQDVLERFACHDNRLA